MNSFLRSGASVRSALLLLVVALAAPLAASASSCRAADVEFKGEELPFGRLMAGSAAECQLKCRSISRCKFYTFTPDKERSSWSLCSIRSGDYTATYKKNSISGLPNCPGTCIEAGVDYYGSDLPDGLVKDVPSSDVCQKLCQQRIDCEFFAYATQSDSNCRRCYRNCWLKSGGYSRTENRNRISGPARCKDCVETGVDYYGSDLPDGLVKDIASAKDCQSLCANRKDCEFFAWAPDNDKGCQTCRGNCWLKSGNYRRVVNSNRVSGPAVCNF